MRLSWSKFEIPHGFLCEIPIHLIYRVKGCAPVGELKKITDELKDQLAILRTLKEDKRERYQHFMKEHFKVYDALLDAQDQRKYVLANDVAAKIVIDSWLHLQEKGEIVLYAVCVMGNHVHVMLRGPDGVEDKSIGLLLRRHKTFTNTAIKEALNLSDNVWDTGFYDRYVRPGSFYAVLEYLLDNPKSAGLVQDWKAWPNTYVDERCL